MLTTRPAPTKKCPKVTARAVVEPMTIRTKGVDSTKAPPHSSYPPPRAPIPYHFLQLLQVHNRPSPFSPEFSPFTFSYAIPLLLPSPHAISFLSPDRLPSSRARKTSSCV